MLHECYMIVTFRFCHRSQSKSLKLPVFKGISADLSHHRFYHISFYPLYKELKHFQSRKFVYGPFPINLEDVSLNAKLYDREMAMQTLKLVKKLGFEIKRK